MPKLPLFFAGLFANIISFDLISFHQTLSFPDILMYQLPFVRRFVFIHYNVDLISGYQTFSFPNILIHLISFYMMLCFHI